MQFSGSSCLFRVWNQQDSLGWCLWPLWFYRGTVLPARRKRCSEAAHRDTAVLCCCPGCLGIHIPPLQGGISKVEFLLAGLFPSPRANAHYLRTGFTFPSRSVLWVLPISKQIISGGGQKEGEMRGKCLAGLVKEPRWSSDEMWQQQSAEEIPNPMGNVPRWTSTGSPVGTVESVSIHCLCKVSWKVCFWKEIVSAFVLWRNWQHAALKEIKVWLVFCWSLYF